MIRRDERNKSQISLVSVQSDAQHKRDMEAEDLRHKREMNRQQEYPNRETEAEDFRYRREKIRSQDYPNREMAPRQIEQPRYYTNQFEDPRYPAEFVEQQDWRDGNYENRMSGFHSGGKQMARRELSQDIYYARADKHQDYPEERYEEELSEDEDYRRNTNDDRIYHAAAFAGLAALGATFMEKERGRNWKDIHGGSKLGLAIGIGGLGAIGALALHDYEERKAGESRGRRKSRRHRSRH
jgi:hypothetical protein